ncbi:MAG: hypothetical protein ABSE16_09735 [Verrucomicrobiota bacterium]|jgi:hypothetical protein
MPAITTVPRKPKIDARAAASAAAAYFKELFPNVTGFSLEEVELSEDGTHWMITLSFEVRPVPQNSLQNVNMLFQPPRTKFKVFKVDAKTGKVVAMKNRKLE